MNTPQDISPRAHKTFARLLFSDQQGADMLSISRSCFRDMVRQGYLPQPAKLGSRSVWSLAQIEEAAGRIMAGELADYRGGRQAAS